MLRTQITLGIILMIASVVTVAYLWVNEDARMARTEAAQQAARIETGATLFHNNCVRCHGEHAEGVPGLCPPLNNTTVLEERVKETGWPGSLHSYLVNTIRGGRLTSTRPQEYIGEAGSGMAMPFWSQDFGGPLRNDQIEDIAYFIENFGDWEPAEPAAEATPIPAGADLTEIGQQLYQENGCGACHALAAVNAAGAVGPTHEDLAETAAQRIEEAAYTGTATTAEEYIAESIVAPAAYIVDGFQPVMPPYANLSEEQLEALVQFLMQP